MYTLEQLARAVGGRVRGDPATEIRGIQPFESAGPGDLALAAAQRFRRDPEATGASALLVGQDFSGGSRPLLQVEKPKLAFARLLALFHQKPYRPGGVSPLAAIGKNCRLGADLTLHPFASVEDGARLGDRVTLYPGVSVGSGCAVGDDCVLHANVVLYEGVTLGNRVVLHAGTVIGADGFGYVRDGEVQVKIPQTGTVVIGDDVEIGANSCVDRATFGATVIESGVKLDNHVHVGHNCRVGANTVIVAQVGISGSVEIGKGCVLAGHVGVSDHVRLGDQVNVLAKSAVFKDVPSRSTVSGQPAMDHRRALRIEALRRRLPELYREWKQSDAAAPKRTRTRDQRL